MASPALDKTPYTIHNLPYGVIKTKSDPKPRCAVAIGEHALDLAKYAQNGNLKSLESGHNYKYENIFGEVSAMKSSTCTAHALICQTSRLSTLLLHYHGPLVEPFVNRYRKI